PVPTTCHRTLRARHSVPTRRSSDLSVTPLNDAPVARDDTATTPENTPVTIAPLANDSDVNGDLLTLTDAVTTNGTVSIVGTNLRSEEHTNELETRTNTYTIRDREGG